MPFYHRDFWEAVEGMPPWMMVGYLRALTYNWGHNGCEGLENDENFLRDVMRIDTENWPKAWDKLFTGTKFFTLGEDGLWHQKRQDQIWLESVKQYNAKVKGGQARNQQLSKDQRSAIAKAGAVAKWKKKNGMLAGMLAEQAVMQAEMLA